MYLAVVHALFFQRLEHMLCTPAIIILTTQAFRMPKTAYRLELEQSRAVRNRPREMLNGFAG